MLDEPLDRSLRELVDPRLITRHSRAEIGRRAADDDRAHGENGGVREQHESRRDRRRHAPRLEPSQRRSADDREHDRHHEGHEHRLGRAESRDHDDDRGDLEGYVGARGRRGIQDERHPSRMRSRTHASHAPMPMR